ncbi:MAG: hypothetical protein AAF515_09385 [Pseudomonadota bacterium]
MVAGRSHHLRDSALVVCALLTLALSAQPVAEVPRGADGKPDLNGVWQVLNRANYDVEPHAARAALALVPGDLGPVPAPEIVALGAVGAVPGGAGVIDRERLPYKPAARRQQRDNQANWLERDPEIRCYLPGIPRANYMPYPFQIVHSASAVFFSYEYAGAARNVYLADPGEAPIDSWMGQSFGRWDGDTFVIEVTGQNDQTWFDRAGNHHSDQLKVTERYTRTGDMTMRYEARIDDPATYTEPWSMAMTLYRRIGKDAELQQFKCVEFVEELQYGHLRSERR